MSYQEGEAFLEQAGQPDEAARTRGDQEKIEAAVAESEVPAVPRDNTMQVTAKVRWHLELGSYSKYSSLCIMGYQIKAYSS